MIRKKRQLGLAAILSNLVFSGFQEIQITKLNKIVAEVQKQGAANYKRIGVLNEITSLNTHKIIALEASNIKLAQLMSSLVRNVNEAENELIAEIKMIQFQNLIIEIKFEVLRLNMEASSLMAWVCVAVQC